MRSTERGVLTCFGGILIMVGRAGLGIIGQAVGSLILGAMIGAIAAAVCAV